MSDHKLTKPPNELSSRATMAQPPPSVVARVATQYWHVRPAAATATATATADPTAPPISTRRSPATAEDKTTAVDLVRQ